MEELWQNGQSQVLIFTQKAQIQFIKVKAEIKMGILKYIGGCTSSRDIDVFQVSRKKPINIRIAPLYNVTV